MLEQLKSITLSRVRRGTRVVLWPPERIGIGNLLYVWMQADARRRRGDAAVVRTSEASEPWREWFPELFEQLIIDVDEVRFRDGRDVNRFYQEFGVDFTFEDLQRFIGAFVLRDGGRFNHLVAQHSSDSRLVLNVRRGDYYSVDRFKELYAFDIAAYVRAAVDLAMERGPIEEIHIVSDNVDWCRAELSFLTKHAEVTYVADGLGPAEHFAILAGARRLILANSTFSYWGGYLSNYYHRATAGVSRPDVIVPLFHSRLLDDHSSYHLDPRWTVVRELDGGWGPPPN